jgi:hypothetical protein
MAFEPVKLHKWEDNIESRLTDDAIYIVENFYDKEIEELGQEEYDEIEAWLEENHHTLLYAGFRNVLYEIEHNLWEEE